ncbi:TPA: hypothetical protein ACXIGC_001216 [Stenotrophomonas maltophilia]|nr:hypothetical protein [Stenotrophomonas maltophilia]
MNKSTVQVGTATPLGNSTSLESEAVSLTIAQRYGNGSMADSMTS